MPSAVAPPAGPVQMLAPSSTQLQPPLAFPPGAGIHTTPNVSQVSMAALPSPPLPPSSALCLPLPPPATSSAPAAAVMLPTLPSAEFAVLPRPPAIVPSPPSSEDLELSHSKRSPVPLPDQTVLSNAALAPWEPEVGVIDLRLLLLKSRDLRRKLRVSQRHATRPQHLRNHNEVIKAQRCEEFAAELAAMDDVARTCGMLPPTSTDILQHAEMFAAQGFHTLPRRRQRLSTTTVQSLDDDDVATRPASVTAMSSNTNSGHQTPKSAGPEASDEVGVWSIPSMRHLFLCRPGDRAQIVASIKVNASTLHNQAQVAGPMAKSAAPGESLARACDGADVTEVELSFSAVRNFAAALEQFRDGDDGVLCGAAATRGAIHAALYRKFVLSAAHHTKAPISC